MKRNRPVTAPLQRIVGEKVRAIFGTAAEISLLTPLAGDASSRRYFRATLANAKAPSSIIVMALPAESSLPLSSEELAVFK